MLEKMLNLTEKKWEHLVSKNPPLASFETTTALSQVQEGPQITFLFQKLTFLMIGQSVRKSFCSNFWDRIENFRTWFIGAGSRFVLYRNHPQEQIEHKSLLSPLKVSKQFVSNAEKSCVCIPITIDLWAFFEIKIWFSDNYYFDDL